MILFEDKNGTTTKSEISPVNIDNECHIYVFTYLFRYDISFVFIQNN